MAELRLGRGNPLAPFTSTRKGQIYKRTRRPFLFFRRFFWPIRYAALRSGPVLHRFLTTEKKNDSPHVGNVSYLGVGGGKNGSNPAMEEAKTEALKLQNELSRVKLEKLRGDLLEKREVIFLVEHTLVVLRQRILGLPALVCAELRELDHNQLYAVRRKVEGVVDDALTQAADTLVQAVQPGGFIARMNAEEDGPVIEDTIDARDCKRAAVNAKRRAVKQAEAAGNGGLISRGSG
jgi:hypothetical protein